MKTNLVRIFVAVAVMFTLFSCSTAEEADVTTVEVVNKYEYNSTENELLNLINEYRVSKGLSVLQIINHASFKSAEHNYYMIQTNDIGHANFSERRQNIEQALGAISVSENVGFNFSTNTAVLNAWKNSPGHRANLEGDFTHFGISIRTNEQGQKFYTNIFIKL